MSLYRSLALYLSSLPWLGLVSFIFILSLTFFSRSVLSLSLSSLSLSMSPLSPYLRSICLTQAAAAAAAAAAAVAADEEDDQDESEQGGDRVSSSVG